MILPLNSQTAVERPQFIRSELFRKDLEALINKHSQENGSDTPDFILASYLIDCLDNLDRVTNRRDVWYGRATRSVPAE